MSAYLLSKCVLGIATIHLERELSFLQNPLNYTGPVKPLTKMYVYIYIHTKHRWLKYSNKGLISPHPPLCIWECP